jgi:hypothetical protein
MCPWREIRYLLGAAVLLLLFGLAHGGIYTAVAAGGDQQLLYRVNRFTGAVTLRVPSHGVRPLYAWGLRSSRGMNWQ